MWRLTPAWLTGCPATGECCAAAMGVQYGEIYPVTFQQVRFSPPLVHKVVVTAPNLVNPLGALTQYGDVPDPKTISTCSTRICDAVRVPVQRQLGAALAGNWNLQLGYVGSRGHKLLTMWYLNRAHPVAGIPLTTATINERRADPVDAEIRLRVERLATAYYDAARASLVLSRWRGLSMDVAYWFSKAMDLGSSYTNTAYDADSRIGRSQSEFETHKDLKARSEFDQPHSFIWRSLR